jgi:metallo-beta-lactamase class B
VHWVVENIIKAGFKLADIKYIINTHPHGEHIGGLAAISRLIPEAKIITSEATAYDLATGGIHDYRYVYGTDDAILVEQFEPVTVDGHIADGGKLTLGNVTLTAHLTPGHMKGVTTWSFPVRDKGKEYNAVIMGGMPAPGPDDGPLIGNEMYTEVAEDFQKSFDNLKGLKCDVYLYVRAPTIELNEKLARLKDGGNRVNPFVDPEGCQQFVSFYEARFLKRLEEEKAEKGM